MVEVLVRAVGERLPVEPVLRKHERGPELGGRLLTSRAKGGCCLQPVKGRQRGGMWRGSAVPMRALIARTFHMRPVLLRYRVTSASFPARGTSA